MNNLNDVPNFWRLFLNGLIKAVLFVGFYCAGLGTAYYMQTDRIQHLQTETLRQQAEIDELKKHRNEAEEIRSELGKLHNDIEELKKYHAEETMR